MMYQILQEMVIVYFTIEHLAAKLSSKIKNAHKNSYAVGQNDSRA
jgi:hypothetical protein